MAHWDSQMKGPLEFANTWTTAVHERKHSRPQSVRFFNYDRVWLQGFPTRPTCCSMLARRRRFSSRGCLLKILCAHCKLSVAICRSSASLQQTCKKQRGIKHFTGTMNPHGLQAASEWTWLAICVATGLIPIGDRIKSVRPKGFGLFSTRCGICRPVPE